MTEETPLDRAHAQMQAAPEDAADELRFYERLVEAELFVLLAEDPEGDTITPRLFPVEGTPYILAFDREERLGAFTGGPAPFVALSGRALAEMLAGQGAGIGVNLDAPSETLLPPEAVAWLTEMLSQAPEETQARLTEVSAPGGLPEGLVLGLDAKLALAAGLAPLAYLARAGYEGGGTGHLLTFIDAIPDAEGALANAVAEALAFSGLEAGALDVAFFTATDPMAATLARVGLRFDIPDPVRPEPPQQKVPGSDPDAPPILR